MPKGMRRDTWRAYRAIGRVVAKAQPNCVMSVPTLGKKAGYSTAQTRRHLRGMEGHDFIHTEHDGGVGNHCINKTSRYHIKAVMTDDCPLMLVPDMSDISTPSEYPLPTVVGPLSGSPRYARPQSAAASAEDIIREAEDRVVAERGVLRKERPVFQTKVRKNDAVVLVEYFLMEWENLLAKKPRMADHKPIDRKGEAQGYIWHQFLRPEYGPTYDGNQVMSMIDVFLLDLASGRIGLKDRQSAWKAFTVYWQPPKPKSTREKGSLRARNK